MPDALAAVVDGRGRAPVRARVHLDALRDDEVLVEIAASGVCHTDLTAIDGGVPFAYPAVFGHEGAGTVTAVGANVDHVARGDRVVLTFDACGRCRSCREGHPAYCRDFASRNYRGTRPDGSSTVRDTAGAPIGASWMAQSSWATRAIARATNVVPIGDDIPFALAAPLGCGVLTGAGTVLNVLRPTAEDRLLVIGAGTVGLSALMAARAVGCAGVTVVEPDPARRRLALGLGAEKVVTPDDFVPDDVRHDLAIDTVGTQRALDAALGSLRTPGTCATVALRRGANPVTISQTAMLWGRTLTGVIEGDAVPATGIPQLIALWRAGLFPLEKLVTLYPFADLDEAVRAARTGAAVKAVLVMGPDSRGPAEPVATTAGSAVERVRTILAERSGDAEELATLWDILPAVRAADLTGLWRGTGIDTGHPTQQVLERSGWFGKNFVDAEHVQPIVCRDDAGELYADVRLAGDAGAWLADASHRGKVTATMAYDNKPIHDHFVRVDEHTLLGVMAGRGTLDHGLPYYFVLEREPGEFGALPERGA
ncbi:alcohol dehydrogenase catalytic domain-containing protein [Microbacter sp. GSS18]|nr:alcohol dehydrogenase catalytic domain-containing protein [Microbacter sp. GSS18]